MAKNFKWAEDAVSMTRKTGSLPKLVWLQEGELANLVVEERAGPNRGWARSKSTFRVVGTVMVMKVFGQTSRGYCEVFWEGRPQRVNNAWLRPVKE
jgi:hypothetical protein